MMKPLPRPAEAIDIVAATEKARGCWPESGSDALSSEAKELSRLCETGPTLERQLGMRMTVFDPTGKNSGMLATIRPPRAVW